MKNHYANLCISAQTLRREVESMRSPIAPATGVAASLYTHQLANVFRVLTDVRVRHLLADEVGLGKTIQALMIVNALRYQRDDLRVLVVVPDELVTQWRDEISTRAHSIPIGDEEGGEGLQYIRLAWGDQLKTTRATWKLSDIDPEQYNVLVVDELHKLQAGIQQRIAHVAATFEHLLLLTATPAFQDPLRHAQLLRMLEPERTALAKDSSDETVIRHIVGIDEFQAQTSEPQALPKSAIAHCAYRRVIRTRRADYQGILPSRRHIRAAIPPLNVESERQRLMWMYFDHLKEVRLDLDRVRLAKRVILSPPSLEQRVDFLRRKGHDRGGLLERTKPLVNRSNGDSRADTLIDLLAGIWINDPSERVLVAAQDNLTVDYLFDIVSARLPLIGPVWNRVPLVAARIRQGMMTEAVEDLAGYGNETNENLEKFQRGSAQVLFAPEAAQVGLNLQCARVLIMYSVPWRADEVEQWIGRLDRIGNTAAFLPNGSSRDIDIYTIVQEGLVDEKVVTVLECFHAFERTVNLDGSQLNRVASMIESAALEPDNVNWKNLGKESTIMAAQNNVKELDSSLRIHLPWTKQWGQNLRMHIDAIPAVPLAIHSSNKLSNIESGPKSWDRGAESLIRLLQHAREYTIRRNTDPDHGDFLSLWYRFGNQGIGHTREILSQVVFSIGADPSKTRHFRNAHAFILRRGNIAAPPHRHVCILYGDGETSRRPLHFINFGNPLHDELIKGWQRVKTVPAFRVEWPLMGPGQRFSSNQSYIVRLSILDPAACIEKNGVLDKTLQDIAAASTRLPETRLVRLMHGFQRIAQCAIEADTRWLRGQFATELLVQGLKHLDVKWIRASQGELGTILNPLNPDDNAIPVAEAIPLGQKQQSVIESLLARLRSDDSHQAGTFWSKRLPVFKEALGLRIFVLQAEAEDAIKLGEIEVCKASSALELASCRQLASQVARARNEYRAASDRLEMTRALWRCRLTWLADCCSEVTRTLPKERLTAYLHFRESSERRT